jgi:GNAT superfamily N-acetyltransferase
MDAPSNKGNLRPLNIFHDLPTVADIIETCFAGTLDTEGLAAIDNIRRRGTDKSFLAWAPRVIESVSLPLSGYVWEVNGKLVGNVSLIPYNRIGERHYLIANVATLPEYRRQGIAQHLTESAIKKAIDQQATTIWLQVREDNPGAIDLYKKLGFEVKYTNTSWNLPPDFKITLLPTNDIIVKKSELVDWPKLRPQYEKIYPNELEWYYGFMIGNFMPGFWMDVQRFFRDERVVQHSAFENGNLKGGIAVRNVLGQPDHIYATLPPQKNNNILMSLLASLTGLVDYRKKQVFEFPPGEYDDAIFEAGFVKQRTLVWMKYKGSTNKVV